MEDNQLHEESSTALGRRKFLSMVGKTALGAWLLQLLPAGALALPFPLKKSSSTLVQKNPYAARVAVHPMAVKRNK